MENLVEVCPKCEKLPEMCMCQEISPVTNKLKVVILQHPQEPDKVLGSARLANLVLSNSVLNVGLSWPNLAKASSNANPGLPSEWLVLFLGKKAETFPKPALSEDALFVLDKKGALAPEQEKIKRSLKGIVILDGSWAQAKTMWWRNPWLLKLRRGVVIPKSKSLYGSLRKEPRRECLSTLESIGLALSALGENKEVQEELLKVFSAFLKKAAGK